MTQKKCPVCKVDIAATANYCLDHTSPHSRAKRVRVAKKRAEEAAKILAAEHGGRTDKGETQDASAEAWLASAAEVLAVGLSIRDDPAEAARIVGLELKGAKLKLAAAEAAEKHSGLRDRKPASVGAVIGQGLVLAAIALRSKMHTLPAGQIAPAIKALAQALELIQGTTQPAYSNIVISVKGADAPAQPIVSSAIAAGGTVKTN